jgi:transcriptional regulator with XRE-family HTH domain
MSQDVGTATELSERIREAIQASGLSQGEIARRMNDAGLATRPETIGRYISGRYAPSVEAIDVLAHVLGVNVVWLMRGEGRMQYTPTYERTEYELPLSDDPVFLAFLETEAGKKMTADEKQLMSDVTRFRGPPRDVEGFGHVLYAIRSAFPKEAIADAIAEREAGRARHVAKGGKLVDRKAMQQKAEAKRKLNGR